MKCTVWACSSCIIASHALSSKLKAIGHIGSCPKYALFTLQTMWSVLAMKIVSICCMAGLWISVGWCLCALYGVCGREGAEVQAGSFQHVCRWTLLCHKNNSCFVLLSRCTTCRWQYLLFSWIPDPRYKWEALGELTAYGLAWSHNSWQEKWLDSGTFLVIVPKEGFGVQQACVLRGGY